MSQWDYERLKIAPCRYEGSTKSDDLVLLAHNYGKHFGTLKNLVPGDEVFFTDMCYLPDRMGGEQFPGEALPEELGHRPVYPHADLPSPDHRVGSCIRFHHYKPAADVTQLRPGEIRGV